MPEYSVAAYTVKIRPRGSIPADGSYLPLDSFGPDGHDVLPYLHALCWSMTATPIRHKADEKFLRVLRVDADDRTVRVEIESGSHGYASRMVDVEDNVEMYQRRPTDAELLPLRSMFVSPVRSPIGLFITERVGARGLRSTLVPVLQRSFARAHPDHALDIEPLAPEAAVRKSLQAGDVKKVCLIRHGVPATLEDKYELGSHDRNLGTVEIVVRPPRGSSFRKQGLMRLLKSDDRAGLLEWNGATYTDMKVEVKIGRRRRTLTVTSDKAPRVTFPVLDDAAKDPSGRPTDQAFYQHAMQVAAELGTDLGFPPESFAGTGFTWTPEMTSRRVAVVSDED